LRTTIEIDKRLMREAMRCSGAPTKKAAVEAGLRLLVETHAQGSIPQVRRRIARGDGLRDAPEMLLTPGTLP